MSESGREQRGTEGLVTIGPRTTVHGLLAAYPFLRPRLLAAGPAFAPLGDEGERAAAWTRVTTMNDVAVSMDVPWRRLVRDIREYIAAEMGDAPPVAGTGTVSQDDQRLAGLRGIAVELEDGGSLLELAERLQGLTAGLSPADAAALERALADGAEQAHDEAEARVMRAAEMPQQVAPPPPPGHPLDSQRRAGEQLRRLTHDLGVELERMGGSPSRRRWRSAKPMVQRLVERIADVEAMFRRHRQAWLPALAVHEVTGLGPLLTDREAEALELLPRLRRALEHDDSAFVAEAGARLIRLVDDVLGTVELVLVPLAERHLSENDWAVVRELEDDVGFAFIAVPPPWPDPDQSPPGAGD